MNSCFTFRLIVLCAWLVVFTSEEAPASGGGASGSLGSDVYNSDSTLASCYNNILRSLTQLIDIAVTCQREIKESQALQKLSNYDKISRISAEELTQALYMMFEAQRCVVAKIEQKCYGRFDSAVLFRAFNSRICHPMGLANNSPFALMKGIFDQICRSADLLTENDVVAQWDGLRCMSISKEENEQVLRKCAEEIVEDVSATSNSNFQNIFNSYLCGQHAKTCLALDVITNNCGIQYAKKFCQVQKTLMKCPSHDCGSTITEEEITEDKPAKGADAEEVKMEDIEEKPNMKTPSQVDENQVKGVSSELASSVEVEEANTNQNVGEEFGKAGDSPISIDNNGDVNPVNDNDGYVKIGDVVENGDNRKIDTIIGEKDDRVQPPKEATDDNDDNANDDDVSKTGIVNEDGDIGAAKGEIDDEMFDPKGNIEEVARIPLAEKTENDEETVKDITVAKIDVDKSPKNTVVAIDRLINIDATPDDWVTNAKNITPFNETTQSTQSASNEIESTGQEGQKQIQEGKEVKNQSITTSLELFILYWLLMFWLLEEWFLPLILPYDENSNQRANFGAAYTHGKINL